MRTQFMELLSNAEDDTEEIARRTAEKVARWMVLLAQGDLTKDEFDQLILAQERVARQYLNTLEIEARARLEKTTIKLIEIAITKIVPHLV